MTNELMNALQAMDPAMIENALAGLGALIVGAMISAFVRYLVHAIGHCAMYRKAGEAGWRAFIPFVDIYTNYKISWQGKFFFLYAALTIASTCLGLFTEGALALAGTAASIGVIYMAVKQNLNMAKCFGKGAGTTIALILFPGITSLVLGFGKAEYRAIEK
jgi:hypothetical protein